MLGVWSREACSQCPTVPVRRNERDVKTEWGITKGKSLSKKWLLFSSYCLSYKSIKMLSSQSTVLRFPLFLPH